MFVTNVRPIFDIILFYFNNFIQLRTISVYLNSNLLNNTFVYNLTIEDISIQFNSLLQTKVHIQVHLYINK